MKFDTVYRAAMVKVANDGGDVDPHEPPAEVFDQRGDYKVTTSKPVNPKAKKPIDWKGMGEKAWNATKDFAKRTNWTDAGVGGLTAILGDVLYGRRVKSKLLRFLLGGLHFGLGTAASNFVRNKWFTPETAGTGVKPQTPAQAAAGAAIANANPAGQGNEFSPDPTEALPLGN